MNFVRIILIVILCLGAAAADGKIFRERDMTPEEREAFQRAQAFWNLIVDAQGPEEYLNPDQRAAIIVNGQNQRLIVQSRFPGPLEKFCWVIPVAGRPQVDKLDTNIFGGLIALTQTLCHPEPGSLHYSSLSGLIERDSEPFDGVTVLERKKVGVYDAAILEASNATSLIEWLNQNGFSYPQGALAAVDYYTQKDWYWVALRIDPEQASEQVAKDLAKGVLSPVSLSYQALDVTYPMKLTATDPGETNVVLYIIAQTNAAIDGFTYQYAGPVGKIPKRLKESLAGLVQDGDRLSVLYGTVLHTPDTVDLEVRPVEVGPQSLPPMMTPVIQKQRNLVLYVAVGAIILLTICAVTVKMLRGLAIISMLIVMGVALIAPNVVRASQQQVLSACKTNMKNMGTGMEMYSTDWRHYPKSVSLLTPNYLRDIPNCPADEGGDYYCRVSSDPLEMYTVYCMGDHSSVDVPATRVRTVAEYDAQLQAWQAQVLHGQPCPADAKPGNW